MLRPGRYRAVDALAVERCRRTGDKEPAVIDYVSYQPGDEFTIPQGINGFYHRIMQDPFREERAGRWERID